MELSSCYCRHYAFGTYEDVEEKGIGRKMKSTQFTHLQLEISHVNEGDKLLETMGCRRWHTRASASYEKDMCEVKIKNIYLIKIN